LRTIFFLVPGTTGRFRCGGLLVELQTARLLEKVFDVKIVTYRQREDGYLFLDDVLNSYDAKFIRNKAAIIDELWIVSWGFDVTWLLKRLKKYPVAYHAHSSGYGFSMPPGIPILAVSRNTLGYWGDRAPRNPLFLVPNALDSRWLQYGSTLCDASEVLTSSTKAVNLRPVDVLVQKRKNSPYVLDQLVPALRSKGLNVKVQDGWVDDLVQLFAGSKVVIYDSADYWRTIGVSEGFGLPPIEALTCGCVIFSSLNHALADNLDPFFYGHQIGQGTMQADLDRIESAIMNPSLWRASNNQLKLLIDAHSEESSLNRWLFAIDQIETHYRRILVNQEAPLKSKTKWRLRAEAVLKKIDKLVSSLKP